AHGPNGPVRIVGQDGPMRGLDVAEGLVPGYARTAAAQEGTMRFETLASGYGLVEGPSVDAEDGLYFSDVLGGGVYRRAPDGTLETIVPKRRGVGGIALHADGGVVVSGRDLVHVRSGVSRALFSIPDLPGWNDICTDALGRVYGGALRFAVFDPDAKPTPGECWRVEGEGRASKLYGGLVHANGIGLSPDERRLYHSDTRRRVIVVHDLLRDGGVANRRELEIERPGAPDGLAFDEAGCLWVAIAGGGRVDRLTPDGRRDRSLEVPASLVTSLCFAGSDRRDLVVVTGDNREEPERRGSLLRIRVDVTGAPVHPARI
ncbi:MAG: SMP-30/gluconolactonase/LRE family protein, partial [Myxococcota bacterium]